MVARVLALAAQWAPAVAALEQRHTTVALGRERRCEPFAEVCRGSVIYTCVAGRWRRGLDCARAGRRDRVTVCSVEPDGSAVCVEDGGAS